MWPDRTRLRALKSTRPRTCHARGLVWPFARHDLSAALVMLAFVSACDETPTTDVGLDAGPSDAGPLRTDAGEPDAGWDAGPTDAGAPDAGVLPPPRMWSCRRDPRLAGQLFAIAPDSGARVDALILHHRGEPISGCNGLAAHPISGQLYGVFYIGRFGSIRPPPQLARVDLRTGELTLIGDAQDGGIVLGLAFDGAGTLYAVAADPGFGPGRLLTLSLTDATATVVATLGTNLRHETIAYAPIDGRLYHAADAVFEALDLDDPTSPPTNVPLSGATFSSLQSLGWDPAAAAFLGAENEGALYRVTVSGEVTRIGTLDHPSGGIAWVAP